MALSADDEPAVLSPYVIYSRIMGFGALMTYRPMRGRSVVSLPFLLKGLFLPGDPGLFALRVFLSRDDRRLRSDERYFAMTSPGTCLREGPGDGREHVDFDGDLYIRRATREGPTGGMKGHTYFNCDTSGRS